MTLDPDAGEYLWAQLRDILAERIRRGDYPGRMPSELELAEEYGTARVTVRRAIAELAKMGLVRVLPGRGTYPVKS
jgi:DNA-binding GntR family transcriptional regulator